MLFGESPISAGMAPQKPISGTRSLESHTLATLKNRFRFETIKAEKDVDHPDISKHKILTLLNWILAMRIATGPVLDRINLRDKTHRREASRAFRMIIALFPVRLPTEFGSRTLAAHGIRIDRVLTLGTHGKRHFVFAESFH